VGTRPTKSFEFPDGYNRFFGVERLQAPEILFQPENFLPTVSTLFTSIYLFIYLFIYYNRTGLNVTHIVVYLV
jgi:hypothetical protein